jgi:hypothetical protein
MLNDRELRMQQTIIGLQRRLLKVAPAKIHRFQLRTSAAWATDEEFQRILDAIVAGGIATREAGKRSGEWYRSAVEARG